jgi:hypothetical protein
VQVALGDRALRMALLVLDVDRGVPRSGLVRQRRVAQVVEADDMATVREFAFQSKARPVEHGGDLPGVDLGGGSHEGQRTADDLLEADAPPRD